MLATARYVLFHSGSHVSNNSRKVGREEDSHGSILAHTLVVQLKRLPWPLAHFLDGMVHIFVLGCIAMFCS